MDGVNGFLAKNSDEWTTSLRTLIADSNQRQRLGAAGREAVEKHYTVQAAADGSQFRVAIPGLKQPLASTQTNGIT